MPKRFEAADWLDYFNSIGLAPELIPPYMQYIDTMCLRSVPVIFEFRHLSNLLGRTTAYLASVVNSPEKHYRTFSIPKRRGGEREISAPYPALLDCQRWINREILAKQRTHPAVHGFRRGRTILSNARNHCDKTCLLKMDLSDFFPSIGIRRVLKLFRVIGYPRNVAFYLARLCCFNDCLPQGAATSPTLSNIIGYRLDRRLAGLAKHSGLVYSRYADDLTFSGARITLGFVKLVEQIVVSENFKIRTDKTVLCRDPGQRVVTGLSVNSARPVPTRQFRRSVKQAVYYIEKYGFRSFASKQKIRDPFYLESLFGKLTFWNWVEPDNEYVLASSKRIRALIDGRQLE